MKILILTCSAGSGHDAVADAVSVGIQSKLPDSDVKIVDINEYLSRFHSWILKEGWVKLSLNYPRVYNFFFNNFLAKRKWFVSYLLKRTYLHQRKVYKDLRKDAPDVIISTFPGGAMGVHYLKKKMPHVKNMLILTDFGSFEGYMIPRIDVFFTAHPDFDHFFKKRFPTSKVCSYGIPLRKKFYHKKDMQKLKKKHKLSEKKFTILFMRGGLGFYTKKTLTLLEKIGSHPKDIQILAVAGKNPALKKHYERISSRAKNKIYVYGYSKHIDELMALSNAYLGKPGGIALSECIVKKLPSILYNPLPGQEMANVKFCLDHGLGVYSKTDDEVMQFITKFHDKDFYSGITHNLEQINIMDATEKIIDEIELTTH